MSKTNFTVTISDVLLENFNTLANQKSINKSLLIENFLKGWVIENDDCHVNCINHHSVYTPFKKGKSDDQQ